MDFLYIWYTEINRIDLNENLQPGSVIQVQRACCGVSLGLRLLGKNHRKTSTSQLKNCSISPRPLIKLNEPV